MAEPLYIILAALGHPHAHEKVRKLTLQAQREARPLTDVILEDPDLESYRQKMTPKQWHIITHPGDYTGIAADKAIDLASRWKRKLGI